MVFGSLRMSTKRQAAITALPCFAMLSSAESKELASLMDEVQYKIGDVIVTEDSIVDSVYILLNGEIEISRKAITKISGLTKKENITVNIPVAMLNPGEAIGLNDTGFFSITGKRTATATALTECTLLRLDLKTLQGFLQKHSLLSDMHAVAKKILRMRLIKQSLPFSKLSHERIEALAEHVEDLKISAGSIIFSQGEMGDRCYLIYSGEVEIIHKDEDQNEHQLAILQQPTLFGEATLITDSPRNATARALMDCELLVLKHEYLYELIESENNVANMFMNLMVDRSRPLQNEHVSIHERLTADKQVVYILKNPDNDHYFKLSEEGWFIWQQLDGKKTMHEITLALADKYQIFAPNIVAGLIAKLAKADFIIHVTVNKGSNLKEQPLWVKAIVRVRCLLESRVAIGDVDKFLTRFYQRVGFILFSRLGKIVLTVLMLAGIAAFALATPLVLHTFKTIHTSWMLLILLIPFTIVSIVLHELGHALATKSFGYEVHYMGVGWYWLGPIAFTDTSDMWLATTGPRVFVNLAGIYSDILVGGIAAIGIFIFPGILVHAFLWLFALFTYVSAFRMLNPLQELDGYFVLMDLFDRPKLRQSSVVWLMKGLPNAIRDPKLFRQNIPEVLYWMACLLFIVILSVMIFMLQSFIFSILSFKPGNPIVSLALPIIVAIISCVGIVADLRSQSEE